jgi:hypothetical protein
VKPQPIPMSGEHIGPLHVLDHQKGRSGAMWWCRCSHCGAEHLISGNKLRAMQRGKWVPKCMMEAGL